MPIVYHVWNAMPKTHAKAVGPTSCRADIETVLSTIQSDLLHEFNGKAIVSFCNRFRSCVAAPGGH